MQRDVTATHVSAIRTTLFVPATKWAVIVKAAAAGADAVCIDLEDAVVAPEKEGSRAHVIRALRELDFGVSQRVYRMNAVTTPWAYRDLIDVIEAVGDRVDSVMVPKAESADDVAFIDRLLTQIEARCGIARPIGLHVQIETAAGFLWTREIAGASARIRGLIFGAGDYAASMRMPTTHVGTLDSTDASYPGHRYHAVMHTIVAAARAHGLFCQDGPYADFLDTAGFERSCGMAAALGFDGKQCIHPSQIAPIHAMFRPSHDALAHARRVLEAFERAAADGQGAVGLEGTMIDEASVRMARAQLDRAGEGR